MKKRESLTLNMKNERRPRVDFRIKNIQTDEEWNSLSTLFQLVFGSKDLDTWLKFHGREPFCRREWCKVIKKDSQIVCHVCWVPRIIRIGCTEIKAGFIGYTATHPDYRHKGLARKIMEEWTQELTLRGEHLSIIVGIPGFYEQFGYKYAFHNDMRDTAVSINLNSCTFSHTDDLLYRQFKKADIPALISLYEEENRCRTGSLVRSREYWEWLLHGLTATNRVKDENILIAENPEKNIEGYVIFNQRHGDAIEIREASVSNDRATAILLNGVAEKAQINGKKRIDVMLPLDHSLTKQAISQGAELSGYSYGIYARILDLQGLFATLKPELEKRLHNTAQALWRGTLRFVTDIGTVDLSISNGIVEAGGGITPVYVVEIPQVYLVKLVTGYTTLRWVAGMLDIQRAAGLSSANISEEIFLVMEALFPKGCPYLWNIDIGY